MKAAAKSGTLGSDGNGFVNTFQLLMIFNGIQEILSTLRIGVRK